MHLGELWCLYELTGPKRSYLPTYILLPLILRTADSHSFRVTNLEDSSWWYLPHCIYKNSISLPNEWIGFGICIEPWLQTSRPYTPHCRMNLQDFINFTRFVQHLSTGQIYFALRHVEERSRYDQVPTSQPIALWLSNGDPHWIWLCRIGISSWISN